jgi:hypothetical protein
VYVDIDAVRLYHASKAYGWHAGVLLGCANSEMNDGDGQCLCGVIFLSISMQTSTTLYAIG